MTTAWRRIGKRIFKGFGWLVGGGLALVVTFYVVLLLINLHDQPPSEFALRLEDIYRNRAAVADADNAYIHVLGFGAPPDVDAYETGSRRFGWLRQRAEHPQDQAQPDPFPRDPEYQPPRSPVVQKINAACRPGSNQCDAALTGDEVALLEALAAEQWRLDRYLNLLRQAGWLEVIPSDPAAPMPAYLPVMDAQRLWLAKAYYLAGQKDAGGVREMLEQDMRFWRGVLASSNSLLSKMIAVAALTRNFEMGNLALRKLPPEMQLAGMPAAWRVPLTDQERSMQQPFTNEWIFGRNVLRPLQSMQVPAGTPDNRNLLSRLQDRAARPMFQLQDTTNQSAEMFLRAIEALEVPIEQFSDGLAAAKEIFESPGESVGTIGNLYNPIGDVLAGIAGANYGSYPPRVTDVEGVRRAAVLASELRSRKVAVANIRAEIDASTLRTPYTGAPFVWDSKAQAILFIGLEPKERGQHYFKY